MKLSKRANTIVLWILAVALLVGMIVTFTPTLGNFGGAATTETVALRVNGQPITALEVARAQQNQLYNRVSEGEVGDDLELLLLNEIVRQEVLRQAAAQTNVSGGEVRSAVNEWRASQGVAGTGNDSAYLSVINRLGFTDATFRDYWREQLRQEKYLESLTESVSVTDAEVETFFEANRNSYTSEERIVAREIVVEDEEAAQGLYTRAVGGEDFAELASEFSIERAEQGGALGASGDSNEPQPVRRAALPTPVARAAFNLAGPGVTEPVSAGGVYYIVSVEELIPAAPLPFDEVAEQVRSDALTAKQNGVVEDHFETLLANATVTVPEQSTYSYNNPVVAQVGDHAITAADLARITYLNPQVQQFLNPQSASLITSFFKDSFLQDLIRRELAYQGAQNLEGDFVGTRGTVATSALSFVSRDADASEEAIQSYYADNLDTFTIPASAEVTRVDFGSQESAENFRQALLDGDSVEAALSTFSGEVSDLGTVNPGQLPETLDTALFDFEGESFTAVSSEDDREVSSILVVQEAVEPEAAPESDAGETTEGETTEGDVTEDATEDATEEESTEGETAPEGETPSDEETAPEGEAAPEGDEQPTSDAAPADEATDTTDTATTDANTSETDVAEETDVEATDDTATDDTATDTDETADVSDLDTVPTAEDEAVEPELRDVYVVLVATRTQERVQPLEEVRQQVEESALAAERQALQQEWIEGLRAEIEVTNFRAAATPPAPEFSTEPAPVEDVPEGPLPGDETDPDAEQPENAPVPPADETDDTGSDTGSEDSEQDDAEQGDAPVAPTEDADDVTPTDEAERASEGEAAPTDETAPADETAPTDEAPADQNDIGSDDTSTDDAPADDTD